MNRNSNLSAILLIFVFSIFCFAQNPTVDPTFTPALSKNGGAYFNPVVQPDGKVIVAGNFQVVNGEIRYGVARLNVDGTTDTTFNCAECHTKIQIINNAIVQPDGKILIAGRESIYVQNGEMIRINPDGSLDNSFEYPGSESTNGSLTVKGVYPDGKILVINSGLSSILFRLNPDGSKDTTFTPLTTTSDNTQFLNAKILPDGRVFVFGNNSYGTLALLNYDGTKSNLFESPSLSYFGSPGSITDIALQADGKLALIGTFSSINGITRRNLARLNADQSVDTSFNPPATFFPGVGSGQIIALSNNKLLIGSNSVTNNLPRVFRLNNDGSRDNSFNPAFTNYIFASMLIDSSERVYVFGHISFGDAPLNRLIRFNTDGSYDSSYAPKIELAGGVSALKLLADGKILVGGTYDKSNGLSRKTVSRLNLDGTTDAVFDSQERFTGTIKDFEVQTDGWIIMTGDFSYDGTPKKIVSLSPNGTINTSFNVSATGTSIDDAAITADGRIIIAGDFSSINSTPRTAIARIYPGGFLDPDFNVQIGSGGKITTAIVQPDGKILIAGNFSGVNGFSRSNLARLNSDGTLDTSFNASVNPLLKILIKPDGKYLALNSQTIYQLNADGSADNSFNFPALNTGGSLRSFAVLDDNSIVISGIFGSLNGIPFFNIARLKPDGTPDATSFRKGIDSPVNVFLKQPDGKLLAGGDFKYIDNRPRTGLARLSFTSVTVTTPFDFDGDGRADISVYRPANATWYQLLGTNYQFVTRTLGESGVKIVPADYDGDGKTDYAVFRPSPDGNSARSEWVYITSRDNFPRSMRWGSAGDIPLPSDVNGDGTADFVVFRPSDNNWYRLTTTGQVSVINFGSAGDKPLIGDFDGDGKADPAIFRPSTGAWWYAASSAGNAFRAVQWGVSSDVPVPADYDGDGKTDLAVYRPSNGGWYIFNSASGTATIQQFGLAEDKPVAADYDGDGKADIAVFRPASGEWFLLRSTAGFTGLQWGTNNDIPIPNSFIQ